MKTSILTTLRDAPNDGLLDRRTEPEFYTQFWELAKRYFPEWTSSYPDGFVPDFNARSISDPGLVTLRLFSVLCRYLTLELNRTPTNQNLAFYDFLGLRQLLPVPALVPLVYALTPNGLSVSIERGRQITTAYDPRIIFEMLREVGVLPVVLSDIQFLDAGSDKITDYGSQLGNTTTSKRMPHQLYLGDPELFDFVSENTKLEIQFSGANLFDKWFPPKQWTLFKADTALQVDVAGAYDQLTATLSVSENPGAVVPDPPGVLATQYEDLSWVCVEPAESVRVNRNDGVILPEITSIKAVLVEDVGILPTYSAFNDSPLDIKKGVQPFGETPDTYDTFYLGSYVFGLKGVEVTLNVEVTPININNVSAQLTWEYWNGINWLPLFVTDNTCSFTKSGTISFTLTGQVESCTINGQTDFWVRCSITSGAYGTKGETVVTESAAQIFSRVPNTVLTDGLFCDPNIIRANLITWFDLNKINFGFKYCEAQYWPPFIQSLLICFRYEKTPSMALAYNNDWTTLYENRHPYIPANSPAFLATGFELSADQRLNGEIVSVLFMLKDECRMMSLAPTFYYWNGLTWKAMSVEWMDNQLVGACLVGLCIPDDIVASSLCGSAERYWISMKSQTVRNPADILAGIFVNAGIAAGYTTIVNRVLGSGTGQADFTIKCPDTPILNLTLEIYETSDSESDASVDDRSSGEVYSSDTKSAAADDASASGEGTSEDTDDNSGGSWIEWEAVETFAFSGPRDRVYILDALNGTIYFGNGVNGLSVPQGSNNIRATKYQTPLGRSKGVVPVGSLNQLQTSESGIQSVTNPMVANGVVDMQSRPDFLKRAPAILKSRQRAMSAGDYIALVEQASPKVARALLVSDPLYPGVTIQILTNVEADSYAPSTALIDEVATFLQSHAVACAGQLVKVSGPQYQQVDLEIAGTPSQSIVSANMLSSCEARIRDNIRDYLNPLTGGPDGRGWTPGDPISMYPLSRRLKELVVLERAEAPGNKGQNRISLETNRLPAVGNLNIRLFTASRSNDNIPTKGRAGR